MQAKTTRRCKALLLSGVRETVINFTDASEGKALLCRFDRAGFGGHAKYLDFRRAFGVGLVRGPRDVLFRFWESIADRTEPDLIGQMYSRSGSF